MELFRTLLMQKVHGRMWHLGQGIWLEGPPTAGWAGRGMGGWVGAGLGADAVPASCCRCPVCGGTKLSPSLTSPRPHPCTNTPQVSFFDRHRASELASLISVELDTIRSFVFKWVHRGLQ